MLNATHQLQMFHVVGVQFPRLLGAHHPQFCGASHITLLCKLLILQIETRRATSKRCLLRAEPLHDHAWSNEGVAFTHALPVQPKNANYNQSD